MANNLDGQNFRTKVMQALEQEVETGNVRVILWLAEKMKLLSDTNQDQEQDLVHVLEKLTPEDLRDFQELSRIGADAG